MATPRVCSYDEAPALALQLTAEILSQPDGVVVFPTDTVYGLIARAECSAAYRRIFELKARPADQPLQLLLAPGSPFYATARVALRGAGEHTAQFERGQATVVFPAALFPGLPPEISAVQPGPVGLRAPDYPPLTALWEVLGVKQLLWATSANATGAPAITTAVDVLAWIESLADPPGLVVLRRETLAGGPSAVLRLADGAVLRPRP